MMKLFKSASLVMSFIAAFAMLISPASAASKSQSRPWMNPHQPVAKRVKELMSQMTLNDKIHMLHGSSGSSYVGYVPAIPRLGIPALKLEDGPAGVADGMTKVTQLPAPIAAGATWDPSIANQYGKVIGTEEKGKGANVDLGPTVNIVRNPLWGRAFESFGADPYLTSKMGVSDIKGIQSTGIMAQVKHWDVYNQETYRNTPQDNSIISKRTMHEIYMPPFREAVKKADVASVMCSYSTVNGKYACGNKYLLTDVLKNQWKYPGFVTSDWGATHSTIQAAKAGLDMEMPGANDFGQSLKNAVLDGQVSMSVINDKVRRILYEMFRFGFFDHPSTGSSSADVATAQHAKVALKTAEQGTVLLKNNNHILPFDANKLKSIAVIGPDASSQPMSAGGGSAHVNASSVVTPLQGIKKRAGNGVTVNYAAGILPNGELPVISSTYLSTPSGNSQGLQAEYFNNTDLSGSAVQTETVPNLDNNWNGQSPAKNVNGTNWSARYTGTITPPKSGTYTFSLTSDDGSRLYINGKLVIDNWNYQAPTTKTGKVKLTKGLSVKIRVEYMQGGGGSVLHLGWKMPGANLMQQAVKTAKNADVAVVFANDKESEGSDRQSLNLPDNQDKLIQEVAQANPHTIVVLNTGAPVLMPWNNQVQGVVEAWYPGQEDGKAIASVLFGDVNPSGHLPVTFPASAKSMPAASKKQFPGVNGNVYYSEGLDVGYRWYDAKNVKPLYPFGYGLSYTTFKYSHLHIAPGHPDGPGKGGHGDAKVSVDITNTGSRTGSAVPQLYIGDPKSANEPPKQLKGFQKVSLKPGQAKKVQFNLGPQAFSIWDSNANSWTILNGTYKIMVGSSSQNIRLQGKLPIRRTLGSRYVSLKAGSSVMTGSSESVTTKVTNTGDYPMNHLKVSLKVPKGWAAKAVSAKPRHVKPSSSANIEWKVTRPENAKPGINTISATANWNGAGGKHSSSADTNITVPYSSLSAAFNNTGISDNSDISAANLDGNGYSYSAQALAAVGIKPGATVKSNNFSFTWPNVQAGKPDNVQTEGQVIASGSGSELGFLGAGTFGTQSGKGTITYTDGTTQQFTLALSDWYSNKAADGDTLVATASDWNYPSGGIGDHKVSVYATSVPLKSGKKIASVTLPNNSDLHIFALATK